jgi:hypothetical protein
MKAGPVQKLDRRFILISGARCDFNSEQILSCSHGAVALQALKSLSQANRAPHAGPISSVEVNPNPMDSSGSWAVRC